MQWRRLGLAVALVVTGCIDTGAPLDPPEDGGDLGDAEPLPEGAGGGGAGCLEVVVYDQSAYNIAANELRAAGPRCGQYWLSLPPVDSPYGARTGPRDGRGPV